MNTAILILTYLACVLTGAAIGAVFVALTTSSWRPPSGTLRIDTSDPDGPPILFLELKQNTDDIGKMETIVLTVRDESYLPHE